jgi:hypothetical protein
VFELTMPTGHTHIIQAEPQPVGEWPAELDTDAAD